MRRNNSDYLDLVCPEYLELKEPDFLFDDAPLPDWLEPEAQSEPTPPPDAEPSLDHVASFIAGLAPDESDSSRHDSVDAMQARRNAAGAIKTFDLWGASHPEMAMRVGLDIAAGPAHAENDTRTFWTAPRQIPMSSMSELKCLLAAAHVVYADGALWRYDGHTGTWQEISHSAVNKAIYAYAGFPHGTIRKGGEKAELFMTAGIASSIRQTLYDLIDQPRFFSGARKNGIPLTSGYWGIYEGRIARWDHDPWHLIRYSYAFDWTPKIITALSSDIDVSAWDALSHEWDVYCPVWMWLLRKVLSEQSDAAQCLQEWIAAAVTGQATQYQVALLFVGKGGNGKGTVMKAIAQLFPPGTVCSTNPGAWTQDYHRIALLGKLLNICLETSGFARPDAIKGTITGDKIETRRTGAASSAPFDYEPVAAHVFSANKMPEVAIDSAILDRFIVIPFLRKFRGSAQQVKEASILAALRCEMPGMLFWVCGGLLRLSRTGKITRPEASAAQLRRWELQASPISRFLDECCVRDPSAHVEGRLLYETFRTWCQHEGIQDRFVHTRIAFTEALAEAGHPVEMKGPSNKRTRAYVGLKRIS